MMRSLLLNLILPLLAGTLAFVALIKLMSFIGFFNLVLLWLFGWALFLVVCFARGGDQPSP